MSVSEPLEIQPNGLIPRLEEVTPTAWDPANADMHGIFGQNSRDIRSRSFNLLRSRVLKLLDAKGWQSFAVVSATPGSGKSFIASNLAVALSRTADRIVYLFDFDLRRPSLADVFGLPIEHTINEFLTGEIESLHSVAKRLGDEKLLIFPSSPRQEATSELLSSVRMTELAAELKNLPRNVLCVVDLPPVFANDDAAIVTAKLDSYLFVIEEGRTTKTQVKESMNILAPAVCMGTVLNRYFKGLIADDYGYGGEAYGDYYR